MFNPTRDEARKFYIEAWRKRREGMPATGMEIMVADVIAAHPEYHGLFEDGERSIEREWMPEGGQVNPFLHLSLHVAVHEQLSVDQPKGIVAAHKTLTQRLGDPLEADHRIMECLGEQIWQVQNRRIPFNSETYLACIHAHGKLDPH